MEDVEIDLRPLVRALVQSWRFITAIALIMAAIAGSLTALRAPLYVATAQLVYVPQQTQVDLKSNVTDQPAAVDPGRLQAGLLTLSENAGVMQDVLAAVGNKLSPRLQQLGALQGVIKLDAIGNTNVLQARVTTTNEEDSKLVANAWSVAFAKLANRTLAQHATGGELMTELGQARLDYAAKQQQLSNSPLNEEVNRLRRQVNDLQSSLNTLQLSRLQVITNTLTAQTKTQTELLSAYTTNVLSGISIPVGVARRAQIAQMTNLYSNTNRLTQLRDDVLALRDQVQKGSTSGTALAYNLLKAQLFAGSTELADKLQLQSTTTDVPTLSDLDVLVETTDAHLTSTREQITALTAAFQNGTAYALPSPDVIKQAQEAHKDVAAQSEAVNLLNAQLASQAGLLMNDPRMDELEANYAKYASELGQKDQQLYVLTQERDLAKANYTSLSTRLTELQVANANDDAIIRVAGISAVTTVRNGALRNAGLAFVIGLLLATLFILLRTILAGLLAEPVPMPSQRVVPNK
ncbi:MAG: hypothetical protein H0X37_07780 [Herpetosiphonaceae bacterium]|nr:hypothetical protein [Herpetosiphonaceae bacterium]